MANGKRTNQINHVFWVNGKNEKIIAFETSNFHVSIHTFALMRLNDENVSLQRAKLTCSYHSVSPIYALKPNSWSMYSEWSIWFDQPFQSWDRQYWCPDLRKNPEVIFFIARCHFLNSSGQFWLFFVILSSTFDIIWCHWQTYSDEIFITAVL